MRTVPADRGYLETARRIIAGELPRPTGAVSPGQWESAQKIVGVMLAASNETYVHPTILRGLCERIADELDRYFDLGVKAAGGMVVEDRRKLGH